MCKAKSCKRPATICTASATDKPMLATTGHLGIRAERLNRNAAIT
jgi:hypothetical protein